MVEQEYLHSLLVELAPTPHGLDASPGASCRCAYEGLKGNNSGL